ncbi:hypothetical protein PybrP1_003205 [[Pythium] brassicae (nom. inval.)]|nr:hypothetical protein PybrP1_003205 [[Pythium] brassicae (nom. inval.)]
MEQPTSLPVVRGALLRCVPAARTSSRELTRACAQTITPSVQLSRELEALCDFLLHQKASGGASLLRRVLYACVSCDTDLLQLSDKKLDARVRVLENWNFRLNLDEGALRRALAPCVWVCILATRTYARAALVDVACETAKEIGESVAMGILAAATPAPHSHSQSPALRM